MNQGSFNKAKAEAVAWFEFQDELTAEEQGEFEAWLAASEEHRRAYAEVRQVMLDPALLAASADAYDRAPSFTSPAPDNILAAFPSDKAVKHGPRWRAGALWASAALAACALLAIGLTTGPRLSSTGASAQYASAVASLDSVALPDGSHATLNAQSAMSLSFSDGERLVRLSRGDALFDVAHDADRPFRVTADNVSVTAVGTRFEVDRLGDDTEVRVYEGVVRIEGERFETLLLNAGHAALLSGTNAPRITEISGESAPAWIEGWLAAENMPLTHALERLNRYRETPVHVRSQRLRGESVTGRFSLTRSDETLAQLSALLGAELMAGEQGTYLVEPNVSATSP